MTAIRDPLIEENARLIGASLTRSSCALWTQPCCGNQTRLGTEELPDDHYRFPGPCL
jgi:hypothetical protein